MIRLFSVLMFSCCVAAPAFSQDNGIPAGTLIYDAVPAPSAVTQSPASARSTAPLGLFAAPIASGTVLDPAVAASQITLAPGETVLQVIASPSSIVRVPVKQPSYVMTYAAPAVVPTKRARPEPKLDPVRGRLRDTPGWTGRAEGPASIGCFPAGACAVLNQQ